MKKLSFKEIIENISKEDFTKYYYAHSNQECFDHFNISRKNFDKAREYWEVAPRTMDQRKEINLRLYGVVSKSCLAEQKEKHKQTCLERYGVENNSQLKSDRDKYRKTCLERYGTVNSFQVPEIKERCRQTCLEKYGAEYYTQTDEYIEKVKETNNEKYGVDFVSQNAKVQAKRAKTCIEIYGCNVPAKNREVQMKAAETRKRAIAKDGTALDSSWEVLVYEYALDHNYNIERNIPIKYGDDHTTFIDFRINNKLYEVKGNHLLNDAFSYCNTPIKEKLEVYKNNNVFVITDVSKIDDVIPDVQFIDINNLNF